MTHITSNNAMTYKHYNLQSINIVSIKYKTAVYEILSPIKSIMIGKILAEVILVLK